MASRGSAARRGATPPGHFSFRHDVTVDTVRDSLARCRTCVILDCGCGEGDLPMALQYANLDLGRIRYFGMDQDNRHVLQIRAKDDSGALGTYQHFEATVREIDNLVGYEPASFDIAVLNNVLHEILPEKLPRTFVGLNDLLAKPNGRLCVVDMEELPSDDPFEPWAVPFSRDELIEILEAGGWCPNGSFHPKRVPTYKVVVGPAQVISEATLVDKLRAVLVRKKKDVLTRLDQHRSIQDYSREVERLTARHASVAISIQKLGKLG